jgi:hypothetical protein
MSRYSVRKVLGFDIVHKDGERTLAVFRAGRCVEAGFPNFNTARQWCIAAVREEKT